MIRKKKRIRKHGGGIKLARCINAIALGFFSEEVHVVDFPRIYTERKKSNSRKRKKKEGNEKKKRNRRNMTLEGLSANLRPIPHMPTPSRARARALL